MVTLMVPSVATFVPLFVIISNMGLANSYAALILPFLCQPIGVFLMRQFISGIPDALMEPAPGAAHLVPMPAHTYARVGRWHDSSIANERGAAVDSAYFAKHRPQGFYNVYRAHNHHFLAWGCMVEGRSAGGYAAADTSEEIAAAMADPVGTLAERAARVASTWSPA